MSENNAGKAPGQSSPAATARHLIRSARKAALATLRSADQAPYVSMVLVAAAPDGAPIMLLSQLALHTRYIERDNRAGLLIDATDGLGDPVTGARISLNGLVERTSDPAARAAFLAMHPAANGYADFADFGFFRFVPEAAHMVEGFGRIVDIPGSALIEPLDNAST